MGCIQELSGHAHIVCVCMRAGMRVCVCLCVRESERVRETGWEGMRQCEEEEICVCENGSENER